MRVILGLLSVGLLAGCASASGPAYNSSTKGNLVVYRPDANNTPFNPSVRVEGKNCDLLNNSYITLNKTGAVQIVAGQMGEESVRTVNVKNKTFVRVTAKPVSPLAGFGAVGGYIGQSISNSQGPTKGPYNIDVIDPQQATYELQTARMTTDCR